MDVFLQLFQMVLTFLGPILVVVVTVRGDRSRKVEALEKEKEQKKQEERDKELKDAIKAIQDDVKELKNNMGVLNTKIVAVDKFERETRDDVRKLANYYQVTTRSTRELAQLVITIGEGLRDQHLDGNISSATQRYRKFEREVLDSYMTTAPEIDDD